MKNSPICSLVLGLAVLTGGCGKGPDTTLTPYPPGIDREISIDLGGNAKLEMVLIPAGEFVMGSPENEMYRDSDEGPVHRVRITRAFYLGKYEVTQEQWEAVMGYNACWHRGPKNPVDNVSWDDAEDFLSKLNEKLGKGGLKFRLPTEAQWEYACRAGTTTQYSFGNDEDSLGDYAWFFLTSGGWTQPVGEQEPNAWGLYDMHGNTWEWCADWWGAGYYKQSPPTDPTGPALGKSRVLRGGSFGMDGWGDCRCASRYDFPPTDRRINHGFRVAGTLAP